MNQILHCLRNTAGNRKTTSGSRTLIQIVLGFDGFKVDLFGFEHTIEFFKGQNKVHIGADILTNCFQLLCCAGTNENDLTAGITLLHITGCKDHGSQSHGNILGLAGIQLMDHGMPCGAAGRCHVLLLTGRHLFQIVMCFLHGTHISANGNLTHTIEAKLLHCGNDLAGSGVLTELAHESRCHNCDHLVTLQNGLNDLENLTLIHNSTEGAGYQALTAGHTLILVDHCSAMLVRANRIHTAGCLTGALQMDDGIVGACLGALAAANALIQIDIRTGIADRNSVLGAYLFTGTGQTILAVVADLVLVGGTGMAGIGNDVDQRRLIISLRNRSRVHTISHQRAGLNGTDAQTHSQTHTLTGNGTLQEHRFSVQGLVAGHDLIRKVFCIAVIATGVCHSGNFSKDVFTNISNQRRNSTHKQPHKALNLHFTAL